MNLSALKKSLGQVVDSAASTARSISAQAQNQVQRCSALPLDVL